MQLRPELRRQLLTFQRNEITEYHIYHGLANVLRDAANSEILRQIGDDEKRHYDEWKAYTGEDVLPNRWKVAWYVFLGRTLGVTFAIKLMESGEEDAQENYHAIAGEIDKAEEIAKDEGDHEAALIALLQEERLLYVGSIVLGLNDALVELTGALAGLTLALQNTTLIALTGSVTGIAAAMSMAASEYLSTKAEDGETSKTPVKAAVYTGLAYLATVLLLIAPYLVLEDYYACLGCTLVIAVLIIALFNYYVSVARDLSFKRRFAEMAGLSLSVAALSFGVGFLLRAFFGIEV